MPEHFAGSDAVLTLPEVVDDEDGRWWGTPEHTDPYRFVLALVAEMLDRALTCDDIPFINDMLQGVEHVWLRENAENDELLDRCEATDDGAKPWTVLDVDASPNTRSGEEG